MTDKPAVHVIGGGLAGAEAAWQLTRRQVPVILHEMRPEKQTEAHQTDCLAELVCSNSFRSDDAENNAVGLLHEEMRRAGSLIMAAADRHRLPAGGALAVDRDRFSEDVHGTLTAVPHFTLINEEIDASPPPDWQNVIIATGPLTSPGLSTAIGRLTGSDALAFFDAIAPIIHKDSINFDKAWYQSRYDKGDGADYINCPLNRPQYEEFIAALINADKVEFHDWEKETPYFEGCLPIEVMAARGIETLAFGPMKPVGLTNPHDPEIKLAAIVQLRQDNALDTLYNMVGFQTKLSYGAQKEVFRMIPGLEDADFARLGGIHRNSFINSPRLLDASLRLKADARLRFAGQITGCEGYAESAAIGLLSGQFAANDYHDLSPDIPPATTAMGALLAHICGGASAATYQPMNVNFGLFPEILEAKAQSRRLRGREKKQALSQRALKDFDKWLGNKVTL